MVSHNGFYFLWYHALHVFALRLNAMHAVITVTHVLNDQSIALHNSLMCLRSDTSWSCCNTNLLDLLICFEHIKIYLTAKRNITSVNLNEDFYRCLLLKGPTREKRNNKARER